MMNQQPDRFFQERIKDFQIPVPAAAWERIDNKLNKKNSGPLFLKIAASILLIMAATALFWPAKKQSERQLAKSSQETTRQPESENTPSDSSPVVADQNTIVPIEKKAALRRPKKPANEIPVRDKHPVNDDILLMSNEKPVTPIVELSEPVITQRIATLNTDEDRGVTLIYSADEVNQKYLDKKALAEATSRDKKASTLKKLLDKAYDLKHNQDPFGSLRQKKNEILALNFRSEKQRSQNK